MILSYCKPKNLKVEDEIKKVALYLKQMKKSVIQKLISKHTGKPYKLEDIQKRFRWVYSKTGNNTFMFDEKPMIRFTPIEYKETTISDIPHVEGEFEYTVLNEDG